MEYIVGFFDDEYSSTSSMIRSLKKHNIKLRLLEEIDDASDVSQIMNYVLDNAISCLLIDYNLLNLKSNKYGTIVIRELQDLLPGYPCFLLTHYIGEGEEEKIVPKSMILDKAIFVEDSDSEQFINFVGNIKNQIECFHENLKLSLDEYEKLYIKNQEDELTLDEYERFIALYRILCAYQYVDKVPKELLDKSAQQDLKQALSLLHDIDKKLGE